MLSGHASTVRFHGCLLFIRWSPKPVVLVQDAVSSSGSSELIMSSWPLLKNWGEQSRTDTGWKEAVLSLQHTSSGAHATARAPSRREDAAAQPGTADESHHTHTAHWPSRQEAAHQREFSKAAGGSSASMPYGRKVSADCCEGRTHCAANPLQHGRIHQSDRGHSCSPQQAEQCAVLTGIADWRLGSSHSVYSAANPGIQALHLKLRQQHRADSTHGGHRHDAVLSQAAVTVSRNTLRAVMRDLAKGLSDIRELRCTAEQAGLLSDQPPSPLCDRAVSPHDDHPYAQTPAREDSQRGQLSTSRHGSPQRESGLQGCQQSAGSKGSRTAEHGSQKACQRLVADPVSHKKESYRPCAQPTGHPMVRWRTSLRSSEPSSCTHVSSTQNAVKPHSARGPSTVLSVTSAQRDKGRNLPCSGKPSTGVSQQLAAPQRCRALPNERRMAGESSAHGVAVQHARSCTGKPGSHQQETHQDHKQASTAPREAGQQDLMPPSSPQQCQQHLRQRYLPVYSVFDDKASAADGAKELLCAHLTEQCTPKPADALEAAVEAAQQQQVGNEKSLPALASTHAREAGEVQQLCVDDKCRLVQSERTGSEIVGIQEDILRAALHDFAIRIA